MYSFAKVVGNNLAAYEWNDESTDWSKGMYERTMDLKKQNPNLKILLAVGGLKNFLIINSVYYQFVKILFLINRMESWIFCF